jgi:hypothetical protein
MARGWVLASCSKGGSEPGQGDARDHGDGRVLGNGGEGGRGWRECPVREGALSGHSALGNKLQYLHSVSEGAKLLDGT